MVFILPHLVLLVCFTGLAAMALVGLISLAASFGIRRCHRRKPHLYLVRGPAHEAVA